MTAEETHDFIHRIAQECGASRCGVACIEPVDDNARQIYDSWIARGYNASMHYLENHAQLRNDPAKLLEGARTIIVCAFPYHTTNDTSSRHLQIAEYALGNDYHKALRRRLKQLAALLTAKCGGTARVCVDTAPLRERYWASRSGLGFIGINNHLIIPELGSNFFLGEVLWTGEATPDTPHPQTECSRCMKCVNACPGGAISPNGSINAHKCLSYITIEHRGNLPHGTNLHGCFYGCDICRKICPHNPTIPTSALPEFLPQPEIEALTPQQILSMTEDNYNEIFRHSAMRRSPLSDMQQRAGILLQNQQKDVSKP